MNEPMKKLYNDNPPPDLGARFILAVVAIIMVFAWLLISAARLVLA